ncbi:hypothetical protein QYF36_017103 [Acer negundo]|nr:hypothetical protein QYF36_017103 [Acer negundo]
MDEEGLHFMSSGLDTRRLYRTGDLVAQSKAYNNEEKQEKPPDPNFSSKRARSNEGGGNNNLRKPGTSSDSSVKEPYGPWMQVSYGRNVRNLGSGAAGKRGNFQSQGQGNGTGMKHGNGPLNQGQYGADMAGSNEGNDVFLSKVSVGVDKKKIVNNVKSGSRFSVLNEGFLEDNSMKPSQNVTNRQGKIHPKKFLTEISNRKPP